MEDRKSEAGVHSIKMTGREKMFSTGVEDVESFDDDKIIAYTTDGQMTVKGAELRINRLSIEDGEIEIEGIIDSIEYQDTHKTSGSGIWGKIFK